MARGAMGPATPAHERVRRARPADAPARGRGLPRRGLRRAAHGRRYVGPRHPAEDDGAPAAGPTSPSILQPSARRTSRSPPRSPTGGSRSSSRRSTSGRCFRWRGRAKGFDIAAGVNVVLTKDREGGREYVKHHLALYVGGMGARSKNFYNDLVCRYGYEEDAARIQDLYLEGKKLEAAAAVPDSLVDEVALVGSRDEIADRLDAWRECGVTTLIVQSHDRETLRCGRGSSFDRAASAAHPRERRSISRRARARLGPGAREPHRPGRRLELLVPPRTTASASYCAGRRGRRSRRPRTTWCARRDSACPGAPRHPAAGDPRRVRTKA